MKEIILCFYGEPGLDEVGKAKTVSLSAGI